MSTDATCVASSLAAMTLAPHVKLKRPSVISTLPENERMSPENQWLEDVFPTKIVAFWGTC